MRASLVILLTACGRIDFSATPRDASVDGPADAAGDAIEPIIAPACGDSLHFRDDFDDGIAAPLFVVDNDPGISMSESGGSANVDFQATVGANQFAFYRSTTTYPAADLCVIAEVSALPQNSDGFALLKVRAAGREAEFFMSRGVFHLRTHDAGALEDVVGIGVDTALRFWRVRVQNDVVSWDVSTDNITYFERHSLPGLFVEPNADILIGGGTADTSTTGVDVAKFESVTATGP